MVESISARLSGHQADAAGPPDGSGGTDRGRLLLEAGTEVARPIFFALTIIVLVFLPIFTLEGTEGIMFRPMGYAIAAALVGSLAYALLVLPALSWYLLATGTRRVGKSEPPLMRRVRGWYTPLFAACRRHPRRVLAVTAAVVAFGIGLIPFMGREYMPTLEEGTLHLRVALDPNISLEQAAETATVIERRLTGIDGVEEALSRIGRGETGSHAHFVNEVEVLVNLEGGAGAGGRKRRERLERVITDRLADLPGLTLNITQPIAHNLDELITGVKAELAIRLFGEDLAELEHLGGEISAVLGEVAGAADVQVEQFARQEYVRVDIDRDRLARHGIAVETVQETIEAAIGGITVGEVFEGQRRSDIFLRYAPEARGDIEGISRLLLPLPSGGRLPLTQVAAVGLAVGPRLVNRENGRRFTTIQCNVRGRDIGRFVSDARRRIDREVPLPPGYSLQWGGQFELHNRANARLTIITPITFILVTLILLTAFEAVRDVAVILINLPLALSGGTIALWLSGLYLSVPTSIGFIAIFGIALENGLVLVARLRRDRLAGRDLHEAVSAGVQAKLRPVLMTTFTTILGVTPLLLATGPGAEIQRPLATVVVGGLVTSTLVTLVVLPLVYTMVWRRSAPSAPAAVPQTNDTVMGTGT
jgi:cobalt-zinc-cadmium resistance protein CzcA